MEILIGIIVIELTMVVLYFVIKSSINESALVSELRKIRGLLNDIKDNQIKIMGEENKGE